MDKQNLSGKSNSKEKNDNVIADDDVLVAAAREDFAAFAKLYEKYFDKIYNYIFSMLRQHEAAEDVVSQTFEKALLNLGKYENRGYTFGSWLYTIARNCAFDYVKAQKKLTQIDDYPVILTEGDSTADTAELKIESEKLWLEIQKLDLAAREIVILRYIEEYSIKETAKILNKSEDAVKSAAKRALKLLRQNLN